MPRATEVAARRRVKVDKKPENYLEKASKIERGREHYFRSSESMKLHLRISALANEICGLTDNKHINSKAKRLAKEFHRNIVLALADNGESESEFTVPPGTEKYADRADKNENPLTFLLRVYEPFFGQGIVRAHVRAYDRDLYRKLYTWKARGGTFPNNFDQLLPARHQVTDAKLAEAGLLSDEMKPEIRDAVRLHHTLQTRLSRKAKQKPSAGD